MLLKIVSGTVVLALGLATLVYGFQDPQVIRKDTAPFMQRKLDGAREIIKGLAIEDYDLISKSAQDLMLLSHETDWKVIQTEVYLRMSNEFRGSAGRLRDAANDKNLDGATLAYFEVTLSCVRCHKYIRRNRRGNQK